MAKQNNGKHVKNSSETKSLQRREERGEIGSRLAATPFAFMRRFAEEMEDLFEGFNLDRNWLTNTLGAELGGAWSPQVEMFERDGRLIVRADLPGLTKDDVKAEITDGAITIEGERRGEKEEKREGYYRSERSYGKFYRSLPLPQGVDASKANATFNNGVLEIDMPAPKRAEERRRLEIREESAPQARGKAA